jgi:hypothetical protein
MAYLLDANVFISAKNLHYGLDFCPAFWQWLDDRNLAGTVFSVRRWEMKYKQVRTILRSGQLQEEPAFSCPLALV